MKRRQKRKKYIPCIIGKKNDLKYIPDDDTVTAYANMFAIIFNALRLRNHLESMLHIDQDYWKNPLINELLGMLAFNVNRYHQGDLAEIIDTIVKHNIVSKDIEKDTETVNDILMTAREHFKKHFYEQPKKETNQTT